MQYYLWYLKFCMSGTRPHRGGLGDFRYNSVASVSHACLLSLQSDIPLWEDTARDSSTLQSRSIWSFPGAALVSWDVRRCFAFCLGHVQVSLTYISVSATARVTSVRIFY